MLTAASVETRVLVLLLLKGIAMVLPVSVPAKDMGIEPDLMACLYDAAFLTKVISSDGVRSAIESK